MTLNYDTLLDNALFKAGWNPRKGYGFRVNNINARPKVFCPELRNVILLKPHGSFNWFAKGSFGALTSMLERGKVSEVRISDIPRVSSIRRKKLIQMFIPPLYAKFFGTDFWCDLWTKTYEAARDADRLVIVGCSLIASDFHLRAILAKALNDRRRKYKEIIVVDPCEGTQKKLKAFFRGRSEVGVKIYKDFSTFCRAECQ